MIILACSDRRIASRWQRGLQDYAPIIAVTSLASLKHKLRAQPETMVILHHGLPGVMADGDICRLVKEFPKARIMVLADVPEEHQGIEFIRYGVLGYANTHIKPEILHEAIKVIELGEIWASRRLLQWLVTHCDDAGRKADDVGSFMALDSLTPSENHVAKHLSHGDTNKQIARKLNITERTVKAHLTSIYSKTGVKDRLQLVLLINGNAVEHMMMA